MDVVKSVDHIIDLGPLGGDRGGRIVAEGTPEQVAKVKESFTGQYLRGALAGRGNGRRDGRAAAAAVSNARPVTSKPKAKARR
jgi:excinuclease ABC subunit A